MLQPARSEERSSEALLSLRKRFDEATNVAVGYKTGRKLRRLHQRHVTNSGANSHSAAA